MKVRQEFLPCWLALTEPEGAKGPLRVVNPCWLILTVPEGARGTLGGGGNPCWLALTEPVGPGGALEGDYQYQAYPAIDAVYNSAVRLGQAGPLVQ